MFTVVGSKAVDDIQVLPECHLVFLRAEPWSHLRPSLPDPGDVLVTEEEVVGTHLAGHVDTLLLGNADYSNLEGGGDPLSDVLQLEQHREACADIQRAFNAL